MSIINEALKKAVKDREVAPSPLHASIQRTIGADLERKKESLNWGPLFVILVLVLITGPIVAPFFSSPFKSLNYPARLSAPSPASEVPIKTLSTGPLASPPALSMNRKAQFVIEESPRLNGLSAPVIQTPYLKLSGLMISGEHAYCIINDKILKVGEKVQGAEILDITADTVMLDYNGQKVKLFVSN